MARFEPTEEQRTLAETLAQYGIPYADIANICGTTERELLRACEEELERGAVQGKAKLQETLYQQALNGNTSALLHLEKVGRGSAGAERVTTAELCSFLGVTKVMVTKLHERGVIQKAARNVWPLRETVRAVLAHYREVAAGRQSEKEDVDLAAERARLAKAQAEAQEMKNRVLRGELLPAEEVEAALAAQAVNCRQRLLSMPSKLAPVMQKLTNLREIVAAMEAEIYEALAELAGRRGGSGSGGEGNREPAPSAETDGQ